MHRPNGSKSCPIWHVVWRIPCIVLRGIETNMGILGRSSTDCSNWPLPWGRNQRIEDEPLFPCQVVCRINPVACSNLQAACNNLVRPNPPRNSNSYSSTNSSSKCRRPSRRNCNVRILCSSSRFFDNSNRHCSVSRQCNKWQRIHLYRRHRNPLPLR